MHYIERFTVTELAEALGMSRHSVSRRLIKEGIPRVKEGRNVFVNYSHVSHWLGESPMFIHAGTSIYQKRSTLEDILSKLEMDEDAA